ncbi:hypothetical protein, partial [Vibrio aestuarianus]
LQRLTNAQLSSKWAHSKGFEVIRSHLLTKCDPALRWCVINENENLSNSDKQGFYITLKSVSKSDVIFSYDTLWYSMSCRIFTEDKK